jgi:hypothetical protein
MARKKSEGIESLVSKAEPVSIQEITMLDWYAAFALINSEFAADEDAAKNSFDRAEAMMKERGKRI